MVKGLIIGHRVDVEDSVAKRSTTLELLATSGALEVTRQRIEAGRHFYLFATDAWSGFEFMYILSGQLTLEDKDQGDIRLEAGRFLYHNGLPEKAYFRVETDVEVLMVSSPPSFHLVQDEMREIMSLVLSVEEKDPLTEGHCTRLERLSVTTGERLRLDPQQLIDLSFGAYLHDIGKVKVPDAILKKEGSLTDTEWEEMKRHPDYGADMLREKDFLGSAADIVRAHHERFDGTGYPRGLKGDDIPIGARVVAVVDAYDAITSVRPYKKAAAKEEAIRKLRKNAGTQFDPQVVQAFLEVLKVSDARRTAADAG